jgi:hypothetical protein
VEVDIDVEISGVKTPQLKKLQKLFSSASENRTKFIKSSELTNPVFGRLATEQMLSSYDHNIFYPNKISLDGPQLNLNYFLSTLEIENLFDDLLVYLDTLVPNISVKISLLDDEGSSRKISISEGKLYENNLLVNDLRDIQSTSSFELNRDDDYFRFDDFYAFIKITNKTLEDVFNTIRSIEPFYCSYTNERLSESAEITGGRLYLGRSHKKVGNWVESEAVFDVLGKAKLLNDAGIMIHFETDLGDELLNAPHLRAYMRRYWKSDDPRIPLPLAKLLKWNEIDIRPSDANKSLLTNGILIEKYAQKNEKTGKKQKYLSLTEKGCIYGVNNKKGIRSEVTEPLFYAFRIRELADKYLLPKAASQDGL